MSGLSPFTGDVSTERSKVTGVNGTGVRVELLQVALEGICLHNV